MYVSGTTSGLVAKITKNYIDRKIHKKELPRRVNDLEDIRLQGPDQAKDDDETEERKRVVRIIAQPQPQDEIAL